MSAPILPDLDQFFGPPDARFANPGPAHDPELPIWHYYRHPDAAALHAELVLAGTDHPYRVTLVSPEEPLRVDLPDPGSYIQMSCETYVLWGLAEDYANARGLAGEQLHHFCRRVLAGDEQLADELLGCQTGPR